MNQLINKHRTFKIAVITGITALAGSFVVAAQAQQKIVKVGISLPLSGATRTMRRRSSTVFRSQSTTRTPGAAWPATRLRP